MKYTPFPFQIKCIEKGLEVLTDSKGRREVLVAPVGAGKAIIIAEIASRLPKDGNILVVQPNKELLVQNLEKIESLGVHPNVYSASLKRKELGRIVYATPGSLNQEVMSKGNFKWAIIDECDAGSRPGTKFSKLLKQFKINSVLGLTASPIYLESTLEHGSVLKMMTRVKWSFYRDICHVTTIKEVKEFGRWSELKYLQYDFDRSGLVLNSIGSDYTEESVKLNYIEAETDKKIIGVLDTIPKDESVLIFVPGIENAESLSNKIKGSKVVHSKTPDKEREQIILDFKSGKVKILINCLIFTCLDKETEILTRDGWKKYYEMSYDDDVYQWDNGEVTYSKPSNIYIDDSYEGDFVVCDNHMTSIRVTSDHDVICKKYKNENFSKRRAVNTVGEKLYIPVSGYCEPDNFKFDNPYNLSCTDSRFINYNSYNYRKKGLSKEESKNRAIELLNRRKNLFVKQPSELTLDECRFIGFFVGDGSASKAKNDGIRYRLSQSVKYPNMTAWIKKLLDNIGISYSETLKTTNKNVTGIDCNVSDHVVYTLNKGTGGDGQFVDSTLYKLVPYLHKNKPEYLSSLNKSQFFAFMEGLFKADGTHKDNIEYVGNRQPISIFNLDILNEIQKVAVLRGYRCSVSSYKPRKGYSKKINTLTICDTPQTQMVNNRFKLEKSSGKELVWCVTVPKGAIITRRKGKVTVTGNCGFDYPNLRHIIDAYPTNSARIHYQKYGRLVRVDSRKAFGTVHDLGGNLEKFGPIEDFNFENIPGYGWGMFKGDVLLTGVPMKERLGITKKMLIENKGIKKSSDKKFDFEKDTSTLSDVLINFGKHKGKTFKQVYETDKGYLIWLNEQRKAGTFDFTWRKDLEKELIKNFI